MRTKHVTFDPIPTLENIRGLSVYGPGASLFTLGANNTVQQFDLNAPAMMVANVQHPANLLPPSPPISLEERDKGQSGNQSEAESSLSVPIHADISESDEDRRSPFARLARAEADSDDLDPYRTASPVSSRSRSSFSMSSGGSQTPGYSSRRRAPSVTSRAVTEGTYISGTSSVRSSQAPSYDKRERDSYSTASSLSMGSATHYKSRRKPSRLRHEVPRSPEVDTKVHDLFKYTRSRLSDVPYKHTYASDNKSMTNDDLRRQMLNVIFGWNGEVEDLIRDEISRHPQGSPARILLAKWLGDIGADFIADNSQHMTTSDWMILALSGVGNQASQHKIGRAYTQRLLETGDVHAASAIMIGMGDYNDAIEIYVSHKRYMEALLLTCLFFPAVWERQEAIVKKWGEWAILHSQQQLAIRCFACTGKESSEPWTSPSAVQITFQSLSGSAIQDVLSPPLSPPLAMNLGPQRSIAKTSALKLITSFGDPSAKAKFFASNDGGVTPLAAGVTPIADSAVSPGGGNGDPTTAVLRPSNKSVYNTPASARPLGFSRQRLPSIGETPDTASRDVLVSLASAGFPSAGLSSAGFPSAGLSSAGLSTGGLSTFSTSSEIHVGRNDRLRVNDLSARSTPANDGRDSYRPPMPLSPSPQAVQALMEGPRVRNGSRSRIPEGLDLHLGMFGENPIDRVTTPEQSASSAAKYHWPKRRGPGSVASSVTSGSSSVVRGHHHRHQHGGKSLDDYIHSLDAAQNQRAARASSRDGRDGHDGRDGRTSGRDSSRSRKDGRDASQERGRVSSRGRFTPVGPKRSPTSPVPMSPEDLINLVPSSDVLYREMKPRESSEPRLARKPTPDVRDASKPRSRQGSRTRAGSQGPGRATSQDRRHRSPEGRTGSGMDGRGRTNLREGSSVRSPSSPLPMSPGADLLHGSSDEEEYRRAVEAKENFRRKHDGSANRNRSRDPMSPASVRSGKSHGKEGTQDRSDAGRRSHNRESSEQRGRNRPPPLTTTSPAPLRLVLEKSTGDLRTMKDERQLKKEAAARELEERRKSLARRPQAPVIPHPDELSPVSTRPSQGLFDLPSPAPSFVTLGSATYVPPQAKELPLRAASTGPLEAAKNSGMYANRGPHIGLPATPKAMRLVLGSESGWSSDVPVPPIPATFAQASPALSLRSNPSPNKVSPKASPRTVPGPKQEEAPPVSLATLLPSTVYTPPPTHSSLQVRPPIARSMSVPLSPPDVVSLPATAFNAGSRGMPRGHHLRKSSTGEAAALISGRRPSHDSQLVPPPPPPAPAPPLLKELQHLAAPPPPPPAPLPPYAAGRSPMTPSRMHPGMVEVITDEDHGLSSAPAGVAPAGVAIPISETTVPIIAPPAPPSSRGHMRGRSSTDNSIGARLSRATERMRSASRGRIQRDPSRTKSPEVPSMIAPYESIPLPPQMSFQARSEMTRSPVARADLTKSPLVRQDIQALPQNDYRTGLHRSEMI